MAHQKKTSPALKKKYRPDTGSRTLCGGLPSTMSKVSMRLSRATDTKRRWLDAEENGDGDGEGVRYTLNAFVEQCQATRSMDTLDSAIATWRFPDAVPL